MPTSFFDNDWSIQDKSPPLAPLAHIGVTVAVATSTPAGVNTGRAKIELRHAGTAGRFWLGIGQPAEVGIGHYLDPGDFWGEWIVDSVEVILQGSTPQLLTGMEWATSEPAPSP